MGSGGVAAIRGNHSLRRHISISCVQENPPENSPLWDLTLQNPCLLKYAAPSQSIVAAPWTEMCKKLHLFSLFFLVSEACRLGKRRHRETDASQAALADCLNGKKRKKSPSLQHRSQVQWILSCPGSCSDYWAGVVSAQYTHPHGKHTHRKSLEKRLGKVVPVDRRVVVSVGDSGLLAKTSIILSLALPRWIYSSPANAAPGLAGCFYSGICLQFRGPRRPKLEYMNK